MKYKVTFNRFSVILMYVCIIGIFAFCLVIKDYPPTAFIIAWFAFWICQAFITAKLQIDKRAKKDKEKFIDSLSPYITAENAAEVFERFMGVELKKSKKGKK